MRHAIVMRHGEMDRLHPREIGFVHDMLQAGLGLRFLPQQAGERLRHRIERGDRGQAQCGAMLLQIGADRLVRDGEQHQPRIGVDLRQYALKVGGGSHHRPEMPGHGDILELGQRRLGDALQRFAGGVGQQVQMQLHARIFVDSLWIRQGMERGMDNRPPPRRFHPQLRPHGKTSSTACG